MRVSPWSMRVSHDSDPGPCVCHMTLMCICTRVFAPRQLRPRICAGDSWASLIVTTISEDMESTRNAALVEMFFFVYMLVVSGQSSFVSYAAGRL